MKILDKDGNQITSLDFGFVEIGKSHTFNYTIHNDTPYRVINIDVEVGEKNVKVQAPSQMTPNGKSELSFTWLPPLDQKKGLTTYFKIKRTEVYD